MASTGLRFIESKGKTDTRCPRQDIQGPKMSLIRPAADGPPSATQTPLIPELGLRNDENELLRAWGAFRTS